MSDVAEVRRKIPVGIRLGALWKEERQGHILDIRHFAPLCAAARQVVAPWLYQSRLFEELDVVRSRGLRPRSPAFPLAGRLVPDNKFASQGE